MKNTAFVTGAEGFIGSYMIQFLHAQGWRVIGGYLPHAHGAKCGPKKPNLELVQCDLRNGQRLTQLIDKFAPTHIFHLGAQSLPTVSWADPVMTFESNIMGSLNLFEAVRHAKKVPVVVSACSSAEYGHVPASAIPVKETQPPHPLHPYGISKLCLDLLAQEYFHDYKVPTVNIRLLIRQGPERPMMLLRILCGN
jgi:GDP-4-dehydro-6-deoxy-D-mannose reductase